MLVDDIRLSSDLHEKTIHGNPDFPIQYYLDDLTVLREGTVPIHWHSELEFFVVYDGEVEIHIQQNKVPLHAGQGIFINSNVLHGFHMIRDGVCRCPNIVFSQELIGSGIRSIQQKYVSPITLRKDLPYLIFSETVLWQKEILDLLDEIFFLLQKYGEKGAFEITEEMHFHHDEENSPCFEMKVQSLISTIWQIMVKNESQFPSVASNPVDLLSLARLQKMMGFIYRHYSEPLTLHGIAASAEIERSEASRCFKKYLDMPPVQYLVSYRIEQAEKLLEDPVLSISEIGRMCGFTSDSYFCRVFRKETGLTPSQYRGTRG